MTPTSALEKRVFYIGACLVLGGAALVWMLFGFRSGVSFLAGGLLAGLNLAWLRQWIGSMLRRDLRRSQARILVSFFLRLMLIPLSLYAMMRLLFLGVAPLMAGFALFHFGVLIEAILEALGKSPD